MKNHPKPRFAFLSKWVTRSNANWEREIHPNLLLDQFGKLLQLDQLDQLGEELIKINMFLGLLLLFFRYGGNRKVGIVVGTLISVILFGIAHMSAYGGALVQIVLIQGLGSIFCMFCYRKTKNFLTSYAYHILNDYISFGMNIAGVGALCLFSCLY